MKISDLPEKLKFYRIEMSTRHFWIVNGETKEKIMHSPHHFIRMEDGQYLNKSFITEIVFDGERTKDNFLVLPEETKRELAVEEQKKLNA